MATRGISLTIQYVAWDTSANAGKTADASNHTLRWIKDGTAAAPTNSPSEVDATNCPGVYKLTLTASETDCNVGTLAGKSSTANVSLIPVTIQFERLPDAAPGANGGVPLVGSAPLTHLDAAITSRAPAATALTNATWTDARAAKLDHLDANISSRAPAATALSNATWTDNRASKLDHLDAAISSRATDSGVWAHGTRTLTAFGFSVDVNMSQSLPANPTSDTTGQALKHSATRLDVTTSSRASAADYTAARAEKLDHLDAAISSRAPAATALTSATWTDTRAAKLDQLDAAVSSRAPAATALTTATWTDARAAKLDHLDAAISSRLAAAAYVAPNNAGIAAIKAQTDKLLFNDENYVYAVAQADVDEQAIIDGILAGLSGGIQVIVQPLSVRVFEPVGDGGLITMWRYARARAAWYVDADLRGHDLVWLAYTQADPDTPVSQCDSSEISIDWQQAHARSYVALDAAEGKVPPPGTYRYVLRDQTSDAVLLSGVLVVRAAPDAT